MKTMYRVLLAPSVAALLLCSCEAFLDPMPNGSYNDQNIDEYPSLLKGFVDKAYSIAKEKTYITNTAIFLDCATDDAVLSEVNNVIRKFANGNISPDEDPFAAVWSNAYQAICSVNKFLKDDKGKNTQYILAHENDAVLRRNYQGDAFALRAWFEYDLLRRFGGVDNQGNCLGYVIIDKWFDQSEAEASSFRRGTFKECAEQIIRDCDSAMFYLPLANRDWEAGNINVEGAQRWGRFDDVSVIALKAMTYLLWASPAFNPENDVTLWQKAAEYAAEAMKYKIEKDFVKSGTTPLTAFSWMDPNSPECYIVWRNFTNMTTNEQYQYPIGFRGNAVYTPTQELVDAFPMANGYPISDPRSGYDPKNPYSGRDPRFYANIFHHGSKVYRIGKDEVMYTFDMTGADRSGQVKTGLTNYYLKKYIYTGWNANDQTVNAMPRPVFPITWRDMCLTFAEAANQAWGAGTEKFGFTAKQALGFIRSRSTSDGAAGIGAVSDPYLEECSSDKENFDALVRNERRIEFCFEGKRFLDLIRWNVSLEQRNKPVHGALIQPDGSIKTVEADQRKFSSKFLPIPYQEMQVSSGLVQNAGWDSWTAKK